MDETRFWTWVGALALDLAVWAAIGAAGWRIVDVWRDAPPAPLAEPAGAAPFAEPADGGMWI